MDFGMGTVLQFKNNTVAIRRDDLALLNRLTSSLQVMWRGGWAERGEPDGVVLLKDQRLMGVWQRLNGSYAFVPAETGVAQTWAATVDHAYELTLVLLGELPTE
jgi:hypothetical protein